MNGLFVCFDMMIVLYIMRGGSVLSIYKSVPPTTSGIIFIASIAR